MICDCVNRVHWILSRFCERKIWIIYTCICKCIFDGGKPYQYCNDTQVFHKFVLFAWTPSSTIQQRKLGFSGDCVYIVYVM